MNNRTKGKKYSVFTRVTLIVALIFLVVGLACLGSFRGTGSAYELRTKGESDAEQPSVVFKLPTSVTEEVDGETTSVRLRVVAVYVNAGAVYQEAGESASLRIIWSGGTTFNSTLRRADLVFENFTADSGTDEDATVAQLYNWAAFPIPEDGWSVSSYSYVQLTARGSGVLVNEIVFVGEKLDSDGERTGNLCVIPAAVYSATPLVGESSEDAVSAAGALLDRQNSIPTVSGFRFFSYSAEERSVLSLISEIRLGSAYGEGNVYEGERVYGAFGTDILTLGTLIFGMSPFGLRFFSMLAAFGALLFGASFVRRFSGSEKAGMIFAILFALAGFTLALGGLGTPLMLGVFFFAASLDLCHRFYARGMQKTGFVGCLPLIGSGLFGACAVCVHGAFVIPVAGVAVLFALGMVRQFRARRYYLDKAIGEAEAQPEQPVPADAQAAEELSPAKRKVAEVVSEYRYKNAAAVASFAASLVIGAFILAILAILPSYFAYVKLYDNPAAPSLNIFTLMWKVFAGGFVGVNAGVASGSAWSIFRVISRADGAAYSAVWGAFVNPVCLLALAFAVLWIVRGIVRVMLAKEWGKAERRIVRETAIPLAGAFLCVVAALVAKDAYVFVLLVYFFAFALAASGVRTLTEAPGRFGKAMRVTAWVLFGLLAAMFVLYFVFSVGFPLPASLITRLFG